ncbi:hypothetical protein [Ectopseudomonas oleovorans]|uniref:hypothetical protein n=1 Tax=Ectopseudomonas oleovorans TaxID=301 RepID=UPI0002736DBD|nr:hypothetical protein [Pseudomonas oleovorans]
MAGLKQLNWASEGVGSKAAALVDLSTVAGNKISNPPWVKFQSAGWVNFPSAPTCILGSGYEKNNRQALDTWVAYHRNEVFEKRLEGRSPLDFLIEKLESMLNN